LFFLTYLGNNLNCDFPKYGIGGIIRVMEEGGRVLYSDNGYSVSSNLYAEPGKKYFLDMDLKLTNGAVRSYHAETVMMKTPPIDSISYVIRRGEAGKSDEFVPLLWFEDDPDQKNYYLFKIVGNKDRVWQYSVLSDEFLPAHVRGLSVDDGATVAKGLEFYPHIGETVTVKMYSVTYETYKFYKALIAQFNNDGGAFSQAPATPPGNIKGAIGLFRAMEGSSASILIK